MHRVSYYGAADTLEVSTLTSCTVRCSCQQGRLGGLKGRQDKNMGLRIGMFSVIFIRYRKTGKGITNWKSVDPFLDYFLLHQIQILYYVVR